MQPKILFKYPSRGRRKRFEEGMDSILRNLFDKENYQILVSLDTDDKEMEDVSEYNYPNTKFVYGSSKSKMDAVNRDIEKADEWDIICNHADDMRWTFYGFDEIIRQEFRDGDFDKLLHVPDTDAKHYLATYYIAGKTYYNRFGYIYHPSYKSLFADNEVQDIAQKLGKYKYVDCPGMLFHEHPSYQHVPFDDQYREQQALWGEDEMNYNQRKARNFDL